MFSLIKKVNFEQTVQVSGQMMNMNIDHKLHQPAEIPRGLNPRNHSGGKKSFGPGQQQTVKQAATSKLGSYQQEFGVINQSAMQVSLSFKTNEA